MEPAPSTKRHQESYGNRGKLYCTKAYEDNIVRNPVHVSLSLYIYTYTPWASISQEKEGFAKFPTFQSENPCFPMFSFGCIVGGFDAGLLTGFYGIYIYILYNIYVFFAGYLRVFDGLAKPAFPPTAGFRHHNPFFVLGFSSKKTWFLSRNPLFLGYGSHRYIYIYLQNGPSWGSDFCSKNGQKYWYLQCFVTKVGLKPLF